MFSSITRREASHVIAILALGLIIRGVLFNSVGIWGDFGFYIYDSILIREGGVPFIDFIGRSPLFLYALAGVHALVGHEIIATRWFIIGWWFLTAFPLYAVARELESHTSGVAALIIFWLLPFPIAWGMWANTQSMGAFLGVLAVWAYLKDELVPRPHTLALIGVVLGAAFLVRRSSIVILVAFVMWTTYVSLRERQWAAPVVGLPLLFGGFALALSAVYALMSNSMSEFVGLWNTHAVGLISSSGRGGYAVVGVSATISRSVSSGGVPVLNDVCQLCGIHTAEVFAQTTLIALPAMLPTLVGVSALLDRVFPAEENRSFYIYLATVIGALTAYGVFILVNGGHPLRAVSLVAASVGLGIVWRLPVPTTLKSRRVQFVWFVLFGFAAGYLYRERLIHVYYFMDLYPFVSILAGVSIGAVLNYADAIDVDLSTAKRVGAAVFVITAVVGAGGAYPVTNTMLDNNEDGWFTMHSIDEFGDDIDTRVSEDGRVIAAMPTYLAASGRRMALDRPRLHYVAAGFGDLGPGVAQAEELATQMETGRVELVIMSPMTENLLEYNENATQAFEQNFCRVENQPQIYDSRDATLYEYRPDCPADGRPKMESQT